MDVAEEQKETISTQRIRKARTIVVEESDDLDSSCSDYYPNELESDSSFDYDTEVSRKAQKYKKKKTRFNNTNLRFKGKKSLNHPNNLTDDNNSDHTSVVNKKGQRNKKRKKAGVEKIEKRKTQIKNETKAENSESQEETRSKKVRLAPYSVVGHWYIATGYWKDLIKLFKTFDQVDSWRFSAFATCWVKCKFSLIFRGRASFKEMLEFTEELMFWTKKFLSDEHKMKWRVGAIYALYGLYYKHPFRSFCKIRIEMKEYENLVQLIRSFQSSAENPDPAYIFFKLTADGAFHYVALTDEMGLKLYPFERQQEIIDYEMHLILEQHSVENLLPEQDRISQRQLLEEYEKVKSQTKKDGSIADQGMSYVQSDIMSEVDAILDGLSGTNVSKSFQSQTQNDASHSHAASDEISEIGRRKMEVCKKAASLDTRADFLQRKQLRSPQKRYKARDNIPNEALDASTSVNADEVFKVEDGSDKIRTFQKIMDFMRPPEEGALNVSLRSSRNKKPGRLQKLLPGISDSSSDDSSEVIDSQSILRLDESPHQKSEEFEDLRKKENTSVQDLGEINDRIEKSTTSQEPVENIESSPINKMRTIRTKQKARRGRSWKKDSRNTRKSESHESSHVIYANEGMRSPSPEVAIENVESPFKDEIRASQPQQWTRRGRLRKNPQRNHRIYGPDESLPNSEEDEDLKREDGVENLSKEKVLIGNVTQSGELKKLEQSGNLKNENNEALHNETFAREDAQNTPNNTQKQIIIKYNKKEKLNKVNISMEVQSDRSEGEIFLPVAKKENICDEKIISANVWREISDKSVTLNTTVTEACGDVSGTTIRKGDQSDALTVHVIDNLENTSNVSQEHNSDVDHVERNLEVEIIASMPLKKNLRSVFKTKGMVYVEVFYRENNIMVHSIKFKMSRKDLEVLQSNKKRLDCLKKKLHSSLPPQYENYELHLQLNIHQSALEQRETFEVKRCKLEPRPLEHEHCEKENSMQKTKEGSELVLENPVREDSESSSEHYNQSSGTLFCNTTPHNEPSTSSTEKGKGSSCVTEGTDNQTASNLSHEIPNEVNPTNSVIEVKMAAHFQNRGDNQSKSKSENKAYIDVNFQFEGITIHFVKFWMSRKDLNTLQNNDNKMKSLKTKFCRLLPLQYQKHEMRMQLNVFHSVLRKNKPSLEDCRQDSDSSTVLTKAPATLLEASNVTPHTKPSTSLCQKGLSKEPVTYERDTSTSKPTECNLGNVANQDQMSIDPVTQPIQTSDSLQLQGTYNSNVNQSIHSEAFKTIKHEINDSVSTDVPRSRNEVPHVQKEHDISLKEPGNCFTNAALSTSFTVHNDHLYSNVTLSSVNNQSSEHLKMVREVQGNNPIENEIVDGHLSLNTDSAKSLPSTSGTSNTIIEDENILLPLSQHPSRSLHEKSVEAARNGISESKSTCSFHFFSKRNQCDFPKRKTSDVKKPCVPFLFMDKLLKKEH